MSIAEAQELATIEALAFRVAGCWYTTETTNMREVEGKALAQAQSLLNVSEDLGIHAEVFDRASSLLAGITN